MCILGCRSPVSLLSGVGVWKQWALCVENWHRGGGGSEVKRRRQEKKAEEKRGDRR